MHPILFSVGPLTIYSYGVLLAAAYLLGLWGLSDAIVESVAFHHAPTQCLNQTFGPLTAVHVASALVREDQAGAGLNLSPTLDLEYLQGLGLADRLPQWRELYHRTVQTEAAHG